VVCVFLSFCGSTAPLHFRRFFSFLILYAVSRTPWTGDQPVARPLPTHRTTQTQNKLTQTSMPLVGFEPKIPVFERAKTGHDLDCAATAIDRMFIHQARNHQEGKMNSFEMCIIRKIVHEFYATEKDMHKKLQLNSVALVRKRTIPTERPPLVGEVSKGCYVVSATNSPRPLISVF
jgi:hypothetical protein